MSTTPPRTGELLADSEVVYRAFSREGFRKRSSAKVRPAAYHRAPDHKDGLSLGSTPESAVAELEINYGYCSISVGEIHKLKYGLEVRHDPDAPGHVLLCNVPFLIGTDEERRKAAEIG